MRTILALLLLAFLITTGTGGAEEGKAGWAGAYFYVPIGARPTAMGGAYTAVSDDGAGALFNPAGLSGIKKIMFSTSYRSMQLDRSLGYAGLMFPVKGDAVLGVHWLYAGDKNLAARDFEGRELGYDIDKNDHDISIVFTKRFENFVSAGIKFNYLTSKLADASTNAVSFDVGLMFYLSELIDRQKRDLMPIQDIRGGLTVKYLGGLYRWSGGDFVTTETDAGSIQEDVIPVEVALGLSARFFNRRILAAADLKKNEKQDPFFHGGVEYLPMPDIAVRGGYSAGTLTTGAGYIFTLGKNKLAVDYAFSAEKEGEGSEHIFSFDFLF